MSLNEQLEKWCWSRGRKRLGGSALASLAGRMGGFSAEQSNSRMRSEVARALGSQGGGSPAAHQKLDAYMEEQILRNCSSLPEKQPGRNGPAGAKGSGRSGGSGEPSAAEGPDELHPEAGSNRLRDLARALVRDRNAGVPASRQKELEMAAESVATVRSFFEFGRALSDRDRSAAGGEAQADNVDPAAAAKSEGVDRGGSGFGGSFGTAPTAGRLCPADGFRRLTRAGGERELFEGVDPGYTDNEYVYSRVQPQGTDSSFAVSIRRMEKYYSRLQRKIRSRSVSEVSDEDIDNAIDQLEREGFISPTFRDGFFINRDLFMYQLARSAFFSLKERLPLFLYRRRGTHDRGSRGMHRVVPDRIRPARHSSPHLAAVHTLRRSLMRRTLYPDSAPVEEQDLVEFDARKKVGYRIVVAVDVSGAVQFGKRIQRVRKACLAFGYFLKRFHPLDRVSYIAYHEQPCEIGFADTARLKAVNGAGKDIGGCLSACLRILKKDPDRVPVIMLIGDGLPVHGSRAGFYRFRENNRDIIEKAYGQARLLREHNVQFRFMQFREDRHLWRDFADEAARNIVRCARGALLRIEAGNVGPTLVQAYERLRG